MCIEITNAGISGDYRTITADDTTQPVTIKLYIREGSDDIEELLSLTFTPNLSSPSTFDPIFIYIPISAVLIIGGMVLFIRRFARR